MAGASKYWFQQVAVLSALSAREAQFSRHNWLSRHARLAAVLVAASEEAVNHKDQRQAFRLSAQEVTHLYPTVKSLFEYFDSNTLRYLAALANIVKGGALLSLQ